jgi:hypothetical protein
VSRLSRQCEILVISQPYRPPRPVAGIAFTYLSFFDGSLKQLNCLKIHITCCLHLWDTGRILIHLTKWLVLTLISDVYGLEIREYGQRDSSCLPRGTPLSAKVGTNFADKRQSLGRYSSLADSGRGVFFPRCLASWDPQYKRRYAVGIILAHSAISLLPEPLCSRFLPSHVCFPPHWLYVPSCALCIPSGIRGKLSV